MDCFRAVTLCGVLPFKTGGDSDGGASSGGVPLQACLARLSCATGSRGFSLCEARGKIGVWGHAVTGEMG